MPIDADPPVPPDLAPYVLATRVHAAVPGAEGAVAPHTVLPGPFLTLGCRWRGALRAVGAAGERLMAPSGVTGLQHGPAAYRPDAGTSTVLVYLRPDAASLLFGAEAGASVGRETPLDALLAGPLAREMEARTADATTAADAIRAVHAGLRAALAGHRPVPDAVRAAVGGILTSRGTARIDRVADASGVGRRQLERLFHAHVGVTPKRLASLARFAWAAGQLRRGRAGADLALRAGYADQAHFIRAFAELAGAPPLRFLASHGEVHASHFFNTAP